MREHDIKLIHDALRFFVFAAGEGLSPHPDDAPEPETTLYKYSLATGDEDWDGFPDRIVAALRAPAMSDITEEMERLLMEFYTPAEAFYWLISPQPLLDQKAPLNVIAEGRADEVLAVLQQLASGVYL